MKRINDILSDAIDVRINDDNNDKTFDMSKIDFERHRAEFMRRKHQNLLLRDLQQLIEGRLAEMMARNPTRIDYYERYCDEHKGYKNNRASHAIANISRVYDDRLREHDFLASSSNERDTEDTLDT